MTTGYTKENVEYCMVLGLKIATTVRWVHFIFCIVLGLIIFKEITLGLILLHLVIFQLNNMFGNACMITLKYLWDIEDEDEDEEEE